MCSGDRAKPAAGRIRIAALLTIATTLASCETRRLVDDSSFDVLIYVLDACRADRIGAYGYPHPTTPILDELAADPDAMVFERHHVVGNWTKPATASLFTSTFVHQHGITKTHTKIEGRTYAAEVLDDRFDTVAEKFQAMGYETLGLVTSHHLSPDYGFDQGFNTYFDPNQLRVGDVGRIEKLFELTSGLDRPYFAYLHQNACHYPYPEEDRDRSFFVNAGSEYDEPQRVSEGLDFGLSDVRDQILNGDLALTADDTRFLSLIYDAKLRSTDEQVVKPLLQRLRDRGDWDRTLIIVTADHGEELYEHGGYAHGFSMWQEVLHVPLIVKFPKGMRPPNLPKRIGSLTSSVDIFPSLLALVGSPIPRGMAGRSIFGPQKPRFVLSQGMTGGDTSEWALLEGDFKLIHHLDGSLSLFNLKEDRKEANDLSASHTDVLERLTTLALTVRGSVTTVAPTIETELGRDAIEQLKRLGYLQ